MHIWVKWQNRNLKKNNNLAIVIPFLSSKLSLGHSVKLCVQLLLLLKCDIKEHEKLAGNVKYFKLGHPASSRPKNNHPYYVKHKLQNQ